MSTTLAEIVSKIASQGKNPDVSFLKDNPEAQTMLLMALLSANSQNKNMNATTISPTTIETTSPTTPADNDKRKYDSFNSPTNTPSPTRGKTFVSDEEKVKKRGGSLTSFVFYFFLNKKMILMHLEELVENQLQVKKKM